MSRAAKRDRFSAARLWLVLALLAALGLGSYFLIWSPWRSERVELQAELQVLRFQQSRLSTLTARHQSLGQSAPALAAALRRFQAFLAPESEMAQLAQTVSSLAEASGLPDGVTLFAPELPASVLGESAEISFTLNLKGDFAPLLSFFSRLSALDRLVVIDSVELSRAEGPGLEIIAKCRGRSYRALTEAERLSAALEPDSPAVHEQALIEALEALERRAQGSLTQVEAGSSPFRPLAELKASAPPPELPPLFSLPLDELRLVGIARVEGQEPVACFEDGVGGSYILRPGDGLGQGRRIAAIEPGEVRLSRIGALASEPELIIKLEPAGD